MKKYSQWLNLISVNFILFNQLLQQILEKEIDLVTKVVEDIEEEEVHLEEEQEEATIKEEITDS